MLRSIIGLTVAAIAANTALAADKVQYGKPAAWVLPTPAPTEGIAQVGAAARTIYSDTQTRVGDKGDDIYTAWRIRLLTADALSIGNIAASWNPASGSATVHHLRIWRDGKPIDVLKKARFAVVRQEVNLEASMLTGILTASLQTPGLQVGDELEFAATIHGQDPTLGDHHFGLSALPPQGNPGAYRMRLSWPAGQTLRWQGTADMGELTPKAEDNYKAVDYTLRDPKSATPTDGAPARYNVRRLLEYSDFTDWADVSRRMWGLFDEASALKPGSPLRQEIAKIAAADKNPAARAEAALALVQNHIRYVYVGLNGGNYRPATIDESWTRRFGDCKAKTALLLAILRELDVPAEAVLVQTAGGDGLDQRLPSPVLFDHVLVRATIGDKPYWLDGTRLGDQHLALIPPPSFRWVLPLRKEGGTLEAVAPTAPKEPQLIGFEEVDMREGIAKPARVTLRNILRGDEIYAMRTMLASLSPEEADRQLQSYWQQQADWVDADKVEWRYAENQAALILTLTGRGKLEWKGSDQDGWYSYMHGAGLYAPNKRKRPKEQDQSAPFAIEFPRFRCWATVLRLPKPNGNWHWNVAGKRMNRTLGGVAYWRGISINDNVVRSVQSTRSLTPEISAEDVRTANDLIPGFDNDMTRVEQDFTLKADVGRSEPMLDKGDQIDWAASNTPCQGPGK
ncbi:hypothetical protein Sj15T_30730 [Sphingobium sp. TA15]|uniref:Transglutaminase-like protein n=1 Tax=Sphingobium indicum (strain DSM 16413 / CCM 7287 / MTCC 6362 / UT26 / NBRC 101211 / UT26S) TaxID=452662 RepID=D4YXU8_SPHIU|nr:DUF3857 domain-containing protein [Sphingobium indicum]BAI95180.1 transglutaminase-like protein [Sphingobium indicum UT26S]BDD68052.1 hypothetical protein Sj15T_30730 [Sphingobium sp. TA15]